MTVCTLTLILYLPKHAWASNHWICFKINFTNHHCHVAQSRVSKQILQTVCSTHPFHLHKVEPTGRPVIRKTSHLDLQQPRIMGPLGRTNELGNHHLQGYYLLQRVLIEGKKIYQTLPMEIQESKYNRKVPWKFGVYVLYRCGVQTSTKVCC